MSEAPQDLVEREGELGVLAGLVSSAAAGEGRLALIEGPTGIGKMRLLTETRRLAEDAAMLSFSARAGEWEVSFTRLKN